MSRILRRGPNQITSRYGNRTITVQGQVQSGFHTGIDVVRERNQLDDVIAHSAGRVVRVVRNVTGFLRNSWGNLVEIDHGNGITTFYSHLAHGSIPVNVDDRVTQGQVIGRMGATGNVTGAHLHFEVRRNGRHIDPTPFINADLPISPPVTNMPIRTIDELAREVIRGDWGNGQLRIDKLTNSGYDARAVQNRVNQILAGNNSQPARRSNETLAREVIRGLWGNGAERVRRLTEAGYDSSAIQRLVNQMLR